MGRYLGRVDLRLKRDDAPSASAPSASAPSARGRYHVTSAKYAPILIDKNIKPDPAVEKEIEKLGKPLLKKVAVARRRISNDTTDTLSMAALAADIAREETGADAALLDRGAILSGLSSGTVTFGRCVEGSCLQEPRARGVDDGRADARYHEASGHCAVGLPHFVGGTVGAGSRGGQVSWGDLVCAGAIGPGVQSCG